MRTHSTTALEKLDILTSELEAPVRINGVGEGVRSHWDHMAFDQQPFAQQVGLFLRTPVFRRATAMFAEAMVKYTHELASQRASKRPKTCEDLEADGTAETLVENTLPEERTKGQQSLSKYKRMATEEFRQKENG